MDAETACAALWSSERRAFWSLNVLGLLPLPALCPIGHAWTPLTPDNGYKGVSCKKRTRGDSDAEDSDGGLVQKMPCGRKCSWRIPGTLQADLPCTMSMRSYLRGLYWFLENTSISQLAKQMQQTAWPLVCGSAGR